MVFEAGIKQRKYVPFQMDISFEVNQGNVTFTERARGEAGYEPFWSFSDELKKGDRVELDPTSTKDHIIVKKAGNNSTSIIGHLIADPDWDGAEGKSIRPRANKTFGNYANMRATVRLHGTAVDEYPLVASNSALTPGDSIKWTTNGYNKDSNANSSRVLHGVAANKGGTVSVLLGYRDE